MCGGRQFVFFFFQSFKEMMIFGGQLRRNKRVDFSFGEWNDIDMAAQREYLPQSNASYEHTISFSWIRVYANCYERSLLRAMHLYRPLFYSILFFFCYALLRHLGTFAFHKQFHCVVIVFWCLHIDSKTTMMMMALLANDNRRSEIERVSELGVSAIFCCYYSSCQPKAYHITHILIKNLIIWSNNLSIIIHTICAPLLLLYSKATGTRCSYRRSRRRHTCASGMQYICAALLFLFTKLILPSTILCICLMANLYVNMMCVCLSVCMCVWMCMWIAAPRIENAWKYNIFFLYMTA